MSGCRILLISSGLVTTLLLGGIASAEDADAPSAEAVDRVVPPALAQSWARG
ncbi:MAG: hypothetical protein O3A63_12675 [Proteobacteria bacterium]|nr:hypothetical protein [Pseudomonadota bacterium]